MDIQRVLVPLCFGSILVASGGCTQRIGKKAQITVNPYEAQQRVVITSKKSGRRVCVEPPPMTARNVELEIEGKVDAADYAAVQAAVSRATDHQQLYQLDAMNLLLQYALYRLCELGMNGDVDDGKAFEQYQRIVGEILSLTSAQAEAVSQLQRLEELAAKAQDVIDTQKQLLAEKDADIERLKGQIAGAQAQLEEGKKRLTELAKVTVSSERGAIVKQLQEQIAEREKTNAALLEELEAKRRRLDVVEEKLRSSAQATERLIDNVRTQ